MSVRDANLVTSTNPATGEVVWQGLAATAAEVGRAVGAARGAFDEWAWLPTEKRVAVLEAFAEQLRRHKPDLAETISRETGKVLWESNAEVDSMINKVALSLQAHRERRTSQSEPLAGAVAATRYKPHGVLAVFGPFNFPGHLPNGHIVPALLAGNAIVFKPSELTPLVGRRTVELWRAAGLPDGVLNLVQGGRDTGVTLAQHPDLDGLLFTGSVAAGLSLHQAFAPHPGKMLALEMGGNNALVAWDAHDVDAAAVLTLQSAYITSGQRCSCARRLIVPAGVEGDRLIDRLASLLIKLRVGPYTERPEPFMGPVISDAAADKLLDVQEDLRERGGVEIVPMRTLNGHRRAMLLPGLIDVTDVRDIEDTEHFGPFLKVTRVDTFDGAIREANNTQFGLVAGLLSDRRKLYETFYRRARAGVINFNRATTGASSKLPFGGVGLSGNHRPSGYWASDYVSYPVASLEAETLTMPAQLNPGISL